MNISKIIFISNVASVTYLDVSVGQLTLSVASVVLREVTLSGASCSEDYPHAGARCWLICKRQCPR